MRIAVTRRGCLDVPDGINIFIFSLAEEFLARGIEVFAVSEFDNDEEQIAEFYLVKHSPVVRSLGHVPTKPPPWGMAESALCWRKKGRATLRALDPDLTIINGALPFKLAGRTCTVAHDAEHRGSRYVRKLYRGYSYRRTGVVVATSTEIKDALSREIRVDPRTVTVIPTCINLRAYECKPFEQREPAILHIGAAYYKSPVLSIKAFSHLRDENATLYMTGNLTDQIAACLDAVPEQVRRRIQLLGYVSAVRLKELLGSVRAVSCPSTYAVPVASPTVLESFASGTPAIISSSITRDLTTGYPHLESLRAQDPLRMADAYHSMLTDQRSWNEASEAALQAVQNYSASAVADAYLALRR